VELGRHELDGVGMVSPISLLLFSLVLWVAHSFGVGPSGRWPAYLDHSFQEHSTTIPLDHVIIPQGLIP
jgi:hypothetical protein